VHQHRRGRDPGLPERRLKPLHLLRAHSNPFAVVLGYGGEDLYGIEAGGGGASYRLVDPAIVDRMTAENVSRGCHHG
jgi:hypothetical protein